MSNNTSRPAGKVKFKFDFTGCTIRHVEEKLEEGAYVDADLLIEGLRDNDGHGLPPIVLDYVCRFLKGEVKKPRGRKELPPTLASTRDLIFTGLYQRYYTWLKNRKRRYGHLNGWSLIREADFWQGPPNEIAARMLARKFSYGADSWRSVRNIISSSKFK